MFTGPKIVTDGLTVLLDSRSPRSYPGSGTTWYDLSGNNNHGTLVNFTGASAGSTSGFDTNTGLMKILKEIYLIINQVIFPITIY